MKQVLFEIILNKNKVVFFSKSLKMLQNWHFSAQNFMTLVSYLKLF